MTIFLAIPAMLQTLRLLLCTLVIAALAACAGQATLLPQGDNSFKVIAQGPSMSAARNAAESEATKTCRKFQQTHELLSESTSVVDSSEPGNTEYRIIWRFNCVERTY